MPPFICAICGIKVPTARLLAHASTHTPDAAAVCGAAVGPAANAYTRIWCTHCGKVFSTRTKKYLDAHLVKCRAVSELERAGCPPADHPTIITIDPRTDDTIKCAPGPHQDRRAHSKNQFFLSAFL